MKKTQHRCVYIGVRLKFESLKVIFPSLILRALATFPLRKGPKIGQKFSSRRAAGGPAPLTKGVAGQPRAPETLISTITDYELFLRRSFFRLALGRMLPFFVCIMWWLDDSFNF